MHSTNMCILYAAIALLVGLSIGYYSKSHNWFEYYGEIMDRQCLQGNCTTEEGVKNAIRNCVAERDSTNPMVKSACNHPDPEVRAMICPELCDINDVAPYILHKPDLGCTQPLQVKYMDFYNKATNKYDKQAYCASQAGYIRYPAGDPKEEKEKKEYYYY